jgi:hypothetical protein
MNEVGVMLKIAIALVLLAHGVGHSMGLLQTFKVATINPEWRGDSWLLQPIGATTTQLVGSLLWTASIVLFVVLAATVVGWLPASWFAPIGLAASVSSLAGVALFPIAFPTFSTIGAVVVDLAVVLAATWFHWLPSDLTT